MNNIWLIATLWMATALLASLLSIRFGISVAIIEILLGIFGGNFLGLQATSWIGFMASLGSVLLTFLAGSEIEPATFRLYLKPSLFIGISSFLVPFLAIGAFTFFVMHWTLSAAEIAGLALSTTSVAVIYAVIVGSNLHTTAMGKLILAACFITDFLTVLVLSLLFAHVNLWIFVFLAVMAALAWKLPVFTRWLIGKWGGDISEVVPKFLFLLLFFLGWLSTSARTDAVLPAYLVGAIVAGVFASDKVLLHRIRSIAFSLLTPFFFISTGTLISLNALWPSLMLVLALLVIQLVTKFIGVWPLTRVFRMTPREGTYTTLLMATGLTFGSIASLYGLTHHIIDDQQYTVLLSAVIGSAMIPSFVAQTWFRPQAQAAHLVQELDGPAEASVTEVG
jgi:Kef-type K+ transport system membrane component KefB